MADETNAQIGYGVRLQLGTTALVATATFADILSQLAEVDPPELKADTVEATHMKSPGKHRERIASLKDTDTLSFVGHFSSGDEGAEDVREVLGVKRLWRIIYPLPEGGTAGDEEVWTVPAILTSFKPSTPIDDKMTYGATLTVAGAPIFATLADDEE
jgi:predicted secreted protein